MALPRSVKVFLVANTKEPKQEWKRERKKGRTPGQCLSWQETLRFHADFMECSRTVSKRKRRRSDSSDGQEGSVFAYLKITRLGINGRTTRQIIFSRKNIDLSIDFRTVFATIPITCLLYFIVTITQPKPHDALYRTQDISRNMIKP